jgi:hypothetical protein
VVTHLSIQRNLTKIAYVGDVPVEASYHGSALIYRLLENYPAHQLLIVEGELRDSMSDRRLKGVEYKKLWSGWSRPLNTRFSRWANAAYTFGATCRAGAVSRVLDHFQPDVILTVSHDFLWITAARYAQSRAVPLHLICHDDWPSMVQIPELVRPWLAKEFGAVYRQAVSRFCVSPYMEQLYTELYGVAGTVLYPSRASDCVNFSEPSPRLSARSDGFVVAFAGNIATKSYADALRLIAICLAEIGGKLRIYGPLDARGATQLDLNLPNIDVCGLLDSGSLIGVLRENADVLYVPMSFDRAEERLAATSFPSKLTDYTATGLPLLIHGPEYSSAVRWARDNPGVAEIVTTPLEKQDLLVALAKVLTPEVAHCLASSALSVGHRFFSHAVAERQFNNAVCSCETRC